jgi:phage recombination protein Bet
MSKDLVVKNDYSESDLQLIKDTVAKGATTAEFNLFLYRAKAMGLNPLKPGQIYFIKYGNSSGTIVVGLDGFRSLAAKTGKHRGTRRGVTKENGVLTGGWAEVSREGWVHPARADVSLSEFSKQGGNWKTMPETMIQKVAECSALRMAFPDELGGVYGEDERIVTELAPVTIRAEPMQVENLTERPEFEAVFEDSVKITKEASDLGYMYKTGGTRKGRYISSFSKEDVTKFIDTVNKMIDEDKPISDEVMSDFNAAEEYLAGGAP